MQLRSFCLFYNIILKILLLIHINFKFLLLCFHYVIINFDTLLEIGFRVVVDINRIETVSNT